MNIEEAFVWVSESPQATMACGQRLAALLSPGDVVALDGELGAGKTQFTRGLAEGLGLDPGHVSSPTFVMMHEYEP
ncbi:MAG: tRNA (adenosine(37)-N6)-threonylcarbamoyltransferase complex ATPase subunit type 1 TsaE, partial [Algisphaera sp.]